MVLKKKYVLKVFITFIYIFLQVRQHLHKYKGLYDLCFMERTADSLLLVYFLDSVFSVKNFLSLKEREKNKRLNLTPV